MGEIDRYSIERLGIPGIVLMENAALKVVKHVEQYFGDNPLIPKDVLIAAGKGNNAGDAFAVARHLTILGYNVKLYCLFEKETISGDARLNYDILPGLGVDIRFLTGDQELHELEDDIRSSGAVIDGIFGTGFKGQTQGVIARVIDSVNRNSGYTISIDIASGVEAATGKAADTCIRANTTVTFELPKIGQLVYPGAGYTGKLQVESIGMPLQAIESVEINTFLTGRERVKGIIPKRGADFNKGTCGKVAVITGSYGMAGSGCIASKAGLRTGSGLVYAAVPKSLIGIYQSVVPEAVCTGLEENEGAVAEAAAGAILDIIKKCDVAAIGPGLSGAGSIYCIIDSIADKINVPVILDADALNALSKDTEVFRKFRTDVVITPHPGEMSRLTGLDTSYIQQNRLEVARKYAAAWGVTVVLKGAGTIIAHKDGTAFINPTGNAGMATAGSGDALAGVIASLIGQGAGAFEAAAAGVYIHGLAGDLAAGVKGEHGMTAMDIVENIPYAIMKTVNA